MGGIMNIECNKGANTIEAISRRGLNENTSFKGCRRGESGRFETMAFQMKRKPTDERELLND